MKLHYWSQLPWHLCGLSHREPAVVKKVAATCIYLYDRFPEMPGSQHTQSRRFLDWNWGGLPGSECDPPLRLLVQRLADSPCTLADIAEENTPASRSLLYHLAGFRLVSGRAGAVKLVLRALTLRYGWQREAWRANTHGYIASAREPQGQVWRTYL